MAMYLDIPNIPGESASPNPNWNLKIEVQSAGYDLSQNASAQAGSGMIASQVSFSPMHITKAMDRSTPHLFGEAGRRRAYSHGHPSSEPSGRV